MLLADMVALNGQIHTLDPGARVVSGIAVHGGRIVALGERDAFENAIGPSTRIVDLEGRIVVPGIVDSHCHPDTFAIRMTKWHDLGPDVIQSKAQLLTTIADHTQKATNSGWFVGYRFNELKSGGYPTLAELDAVSHGRPVFILRTDAHLGLANSAAFAACGIGRDTPDPAFGRYDRVPGSGEPLTISGASRTSCVIAMNSPPISSNRGGLLPSSVTSSTPMQ